MPKCNQSNFNHVLYNLNRARAKSGDKQKKLINHLIALQKREEVEGQTTWLKMAKIKATAKMKKHGVTEQMIQDAIEKKATLATK